MEKLNSREESNTLTPETIHNRIKMWLGLIESSGINSDDINLFREIILQNNHFNKTESFSKQGFLDPLSTALEKKYPELFSYDETLKRDRRLGTKTIVPEKLEPVLNLYRELREDMTNLEFETESWKLH